jgi:hypothetical protein
MFCKVRKVGSTDLSILLQPLHFLRGRPSGIGRLRGFWSVSGIDPDDDDSVSWFVNFFGWMMDKTAGDPDLPW